MTLRLSVASSSGTWTTTGHNLIKRGQQVVDSRSGLCVYQRSRPATSRPPWSFHHTQSPSKPSQFYKTLHTNVNLHLYVSLRMESILVSSHYGSNCVNSCVRPRECLSVNPWLWRASGPAIFYLVNVTYCVVKTYYSSIHRSKKATGLACSMHIANVSRYRIAVQHNSAQTCRST